MGNTEVDILVIGAGVAGLSAAQALEKTDYSVCLVEASHRIGGRAYSERLPNSAWFDLGCSYLHEGEINPFVEIADELGCMLGDGRRFETSRTKVTVNSSDASVDELVSLNSFSNMCFLKMKNAKYNGTLAEVDDIANYIDWNHRFSHLYAHLLGGLNASDAHQQSVLDFLKTGYGLDYPVVGSLGKLVEKWAFRFLGKVRLYLNCKVSKIDWSGQRVSVTTSRGQIRAKKVLITVSTGVVNSGNIVFFPDLPSPISNAFSNLPCGVLNKIGLSFLDNTFSENDAGWHVMLCEEIDSQRSVGSFDVNLDDGQQAVAFIGGSEAEYLEKKGEAALAAYALECIEQVFGSNIKTKISGYICSAWAGDCLTFGSYSYAKPKQSNSRKALSQVLQEKIYFAGEACSVNHFGTVHGAYFSGIQSAKKILNSM
tara:strand:+ start:99 stop:1379 length:1281 start_codon:yes stop_codon:yes gene_type:complete